VCLFTCLVTRAIHLEVIEDMTAVEFLYAFRKSTATRGTPCVIISDNASQFKCSNSVPFETHVTREYEQLVESYRIHHHIDDISNIYVTHISLWNESLESRIFV
jgi:hypothetical protein